MGSSIENERTFLLTEFPSYLDLDKSAKLIDIYIPADSDHPCLRIRQRGDRYEITKKQPINNDPTQQTEDTIKLTKDEFNSLAKGQKRIIKKLRYTTKFNGNILEIDVFEGKLKGLILADFEFDNEQKLKNFIAPEFCIHDVSHEKVIAGGILSGISRNDLKVKLLKKFNIDIDKTILIK